MDLGIAVALAVGYACGSISGARIVGRAKHVGDLTQTKVVLDGSGASVQTSGVSPSSLQARGGAAAGLPAGAIDIAKALLPVLIARLAWPEAPADVAVAAGAVIGHVYPVYHRFVGGYGISPLLGGLVVVDWRAPIVAIAVFAVIGLIVGSAYLGIESWPLALIPWFVSTGNGAALVYAIVANGLYWYRSRVEAIGALRSFRHDRRPWRERVADFRKYPDYELPGPP